MSRNLSHPHRGPGPVNRCGGLLRPPAIPTISELLRGPPPAVAKRGLFARVSRRAARRGVTGPRAGLSSVSWPGNQVNLRLGPPPRAPGGPGTGRRSESSRRCRVLRGARGAVRGVSDGAGSWTREGSRWLRRAATRNGCLRLYETDPLAARCGSQRREFDDKCACGKCRRRDG